MHGILLYKVVTFESRPVARVAVSDCTALELLQFFENLPGRDRSCPTRDVVMILYDLICPADHRFESWFRNSGAVDKLVKAGQVSCPICGSKKVAKLPNNIESNNCRIVGAWRFASGRR